MVLGDREFVISYEPAESTTDMFGGNSSWRGPIWFPMNFLLLEALERFHNFYGDNLKVEFPHGSGKMQNLISISYCLKMRMISLFLKDKNGLRPSLGVDAQRYRDDPNFF